MINKRPKNIPPIHHFSVFAITNCEVLQVFVVVVKPILAIKALIILDPEVHGLVVAPDMPLSLVQFAALLASNRIWSRQGSGEERVFFMLLLLKIWAK